MQKKISVNVAFVHMTYSTFVHDFSLLFSLLKSLKTVLSFFCSVIRMHTYK